MADDRFLSLGFEPLRMEVEREDLATEGRVPADLAGTFLRIGPNPQFPPRGAYNPLKGDGMVHGFRIGDGRVSYRNRWVRTETWKLEKAAGRALFGTSQDPRDRDESVVGRPVNGAANTNVVAHGGRVFALEEGYPPIEIDPVTLETRGVWTFEGRLPRNMTAHPKVDPVTGEMLTIANFEDPRIHDELGIHWVDTSGRLTRSARVRLPYPALVHDFAITQGFIVLVICPTTLSLARLRAGLPAIAWDPELPTYVGVMPRDGSGDDVRWAEAPARMAWHLINAFEKDGRITLDLCEQAAAMYPRADGSPPVESDAAQSLARWTFDAPTPGRIDIETLWAGHCEYGRIDERRIGLRHRYGYLACEGGAGSGDLFHRGLARYDFETGALDRWSAGSRCAVGEPVFCPVGAGEADGYILTTIYDEARNESCLAIFRADALADGPVARAWAGHRVPMGFHAAWLAA